MEEKKTMEMMEEKIQGEEIQDEEALEQAAGGLFLDGNLSYYDARKGKSVKF